MNLKMKPARFVKRVVMTLIAAIAFVATDGEKAVAGDMTPAVSVAPKNEATSVDLRAPARKTSQELVDAVQQGSLWQRLSHFQTIADSHPDRDGHGNRDTGTSGYKASVDYVANLMRRAGYTVTIQTYNYRTPQLVGVPTLELAGRDYAAEKDWVMARLSGGANLTSPRSARAWLRNRLFRRRVSNFKHGDIALLQRGDCPATGRWRMHNAPAQPLSFSTIHNSNMSLAAKRSAWSKAAGCNARVCIARHRFRSYLSPRPETGHRSSRADRRRGIARCPSRYSHGDKGRSGLQPDC